MDGVSRFKVSRHCLGLACLDAAWKAAVKVRHSKNRHLTIYIFSLIVVIEIVELNVEVCCIFAGGSFTVRYFSEKWPLLTQTF